MNNMTLVIILGVIVSPILGTFFGDWRSIELDPQRLCGEGAVILLCTHFDSIRYHRSRLRALIQRFLVVIAATTSIDCVVAFNTHILAATVILSGILDVSAVTVVVCAIVSLVYHRALDNIVGAAVGSAVSDCIIDSTPVTAVSALVITVSAITDVIGVIYVSASDVTVSAVNGVIVVIVSAPVVTVAVMSSAVADVIVTAGTLAIVSAVIDVTVISAVPAVIVSTPVVIIIVSA
jgi:hypothetical protein